MKEYGDIQLKERLQRMKNTGLLSTGKKLYKNTDIHSFSLFPEEEHSVDTSSGSCYYRETSTLLENHHGSINLQEIRNCSETSLGLLMNYSPEKIDPCQGLFIDLETTGLSGGTGTLVFLIGVGIIENERLYIRQYFLRRPVEEHTLLNHFILNYQQYNTVFSFNGKSFDLPLLHNRQVINRIFPLLNPSTHIDLLHCCRKFWKDKLPNCSLKSLEENLLGYHREDDIHGNQIPEVYFQYLRQNDESRLKKVFEHNRLDIMTMVGLLGIIGSLDKKEYLKKATPEECYTLGMLLWQKGELQRAESCFQEALYTTGKDKNDYLLSLKILENMGFLYKQLQEWELSISCWDKMIEANTYHITPYVELAKIYEHRKKDLSKAHHLTMEAININCNQYLMGGSKVELHELNHRLKRLERKLGYESITGK